MLTTLEANFIQEYKLTGSPTKALRNAGHKGKDSSLPVIAYRMMRKPAIKKALTDYAVNLDNQVVKPVLVGVNPNVTSVNPIKAVYLPTKEEYASVAWKRSSDDSDLKPDLKHKYYETAGKTLKYIGASDESEKNISTFNIIAQELKISLPENPTMQLQSVDAT